MYNPFESIEIRLNAIEKKLDALKLLSTPAPISYQNKIVDLDGLIKARPFVGSKSTIYKKVSAGLIPHSKNGKRLLFDLQEVDDWLMANKPKTVDDLEAEMENYLSRKK